MLQLLVWRRYQMRTANVAELSPLQTKPAQRAGSLDGDGFH